MKTVIFNQISDSNVESLDTSFQRTKILWLIRAERNYLQFTRETSFTLSRNLLLLYKDVDIIDKLRFNTCRILLMILLESCGRPIY